jgi:tripartite-type tricarboxylate transporter receptor subunit TctC
MKCLLRGIAATVAGPCLLGLSLCCSLAPAAFSQESVAQFYKGRTVTFLVGAPAVVVSNMVGAGGNLLVEYVNSVAPRDGTVIGTVAPGTLLEPLLGDKTKVKFDPSRLSFIGSANKEIYVCFVRADAPAKSFADVFTTEVILGATAEGGTTRDLPMLINNVLGGKFKVVSGYPGTRNIVLALEKNEVLGECGTGWSSINTLHAEWFTNGMARVLGVESANRSADLERMGVPFVTDFAKTPEQRRILDLVYSQAVFGRPFLAAPDIPKDRLEALRKAFDQSVADPELLAEAKRINLDIAPLTGREVETLVGEAYATPPDIIEKARRGLSVRN